MKFKAYIEEAKRMDSTMLGFEIRSSKFKRISDYIESWLQRYDIEYKKAKDPHFTIAQITGKYRKDELVRELNAISQDIKFRPRDLTIFRGVNIKRDFIVARYFPSKEFAKLFHNLANKFEVRYFSELAPHISLFNVEQNAIDDKLFKEMEYSKPKLPTVKPAGKQLWNKSFEVEYKAKK